MDNNPATRFSCTGNPVCIFRIVWGWGPRWLAKARSRGDRRRRGLGCLLRLRGRRPCAGRRRQRAIHFVFRRRPLAQRPFPLWRLAVVAGRPRTRRLHAAGAGLGRDLPLRRRRARRCHGDRPGNRDRSCCRAGASSAAGSSSRSSSGSTSSTTPPVPTIRPTVCGHEFRPARRGRSVVRADALDHDRRRRFALLDRHRLFGAPRLWLAAGGLVLSRPGGASLRLRRLPPISLRRALTSMRTGDSEWSAAAGWATDSDRRASPYLRLGVMMRR